MKPTANEQCSVQITRSLLSRYSSYRDDDLFRMPSPSLGIPSFSGLELFSDDAFPPGDVL